MTLSLPSHYPLSTLSLPSHYPLITVFLPSFGPRYNRQRTKHITSAVSPRGWLICGASIIMLRIMYLLLPSLVRVVSNDQTKISKSLLFWQENWQHFPKRRQNFLTRNAAHLASFWKFVMFCHHNALRFDSNPPQQQQQRANGTPALSLEQMLAKGSRHSPCASEVGSPFSPAKFA